ncbi:hypothetical protein RCS94_11305 [Orbaceae bacterium ac157xtp]
MATSSFSKTFVLADSSGIDTLIELDKAPSKIKTRDRDDHAESQKAVRAFSNILTKKMFTTNLDELVNEYNEEDVKSLL